MFCFCLFLLFVRLIIGVPEIWSNVPHFDVFFPFIVFIVCLITGVPEILPITQLTQYGSYHGPLDLTVYVYSVANLSWKCTLPNGTIIYKSNLTKHHIKERIYGKEVSLNGYIVSLRLILLSEADFTNYTFLLINHNGCQNCTVSLLAKGKIFSIIHSCISTVILYQLEILRVRERLKKFAVWST